MSPTKRFASFSGLYVLVSEPAVFTKDDYPVSMEESPNHVYTLRLVQAERVRR